jgi:hypothetical protein
VGNDAASIMHSHYPGPGITLGPALTLGFLVAKIRNRVRGMISKRDRVPCHISFGTSEVADKRGNPVARQ